MHYYKRTRPDGSIGLMKSSRPMPPNVLAAYAGDGTVETVTADEYARASRVLDRQDAALAAATSASRATPGAPTP